MSQTPKEIALKNMIFECVTGSTAYGTNTPTSDRDERGIFTGSLMNVISPFHNIEQVEGLREGDCVHYELRKYFSLVVKQNPNIMELLWVDPQFITYRTDVYDFIRSKRESLLSKACFHTFSGYAYSQLQRIKGHNKWINNPQPKRRPKEIDYVSTIYNSTENREWNVKPPNNGAAYHLGNDTYGLICTTDKTALCSWFDVHEAIDPLEGSISGVKFDVIFKFNRQQYKEAVDNWKHYWDWKENRNQKRSELEEKYGYDTKHAGHLIRLLRMGKEILETGVVHVLRPDAKELLDIRNGALKYEELLHMASSLEEEVKKAYEISKLPKEVNIDWAGKVLCDSYKLAWIDHYL